MLALLYKREVQTKLAFAVAQGLAQPIDLDGTYSRLMEDNERWKKVKAKKV